MHLRHLWLAGTLALTAACGAQAGETRHTERAITIEAVSVPLYPDDPDRRDLGSLT